MKEKERKKEEIIGKIKELEKEKEELLIRLKMAFLDGDISENADFLAVREKVDEKQEKIKILEIALNKEEISENEKFITYLDLETNEKKEIQLTNEWEADASKNKITVSSPLGFALFNKKVGELVEVKTKSRNYKVKIIEIK